MEYFLHNKKPASVSALAGRKKERKEFNKMNISVFSIIAHMESRL
jgi:hypothetical protein